MRPCSTPRLARDSPSSSPSRSRPWPTGVAARRGARSSCPDPEAPRRRGPRRGPAAARARTRRWWCGPSPSTTSSARGERSWGWTPWGCPSRWRPRSPSPASRGATRSRSASRFDCDGPSLQAGRPERLPPRTAPCFARLRPGRCAAQGGGQARGRGSMPAARHTRLNGDRLGRNEDRRAGHGEPDGKEILRLRRPPPRPAYDGCIRVSREIVEELGRRQGGVPAPGPLPGPGGPRTRHRRRIPRPRPVRRGRRRVQRGRAPPWPARTLAQGVLSTLFHTPIRRAVHGDSSGVRGAAWIRR